jgi:hypothetical protein
VTDYREIFARLLDEVADGRLAASDAADQIRKLGAPADKDLVDAFHHLQHFASDEDIRARVESYARAQIDGLRQFAASLRRAGS